MTNYNAFSVHHILLSVLLILYCVCCACGKNVAVFSNASAAINVSAAAKATSDGVKSATDGANVNAKSALNTVFMNQFAVHVNGDNEAADRIAAKHGFANLGQIGSLKGYYLLEHQHVRKRSLDDSPEHHSLLEDEPEVTWVQQQTELKRPKRDLFEEARAFPLTSGSYLRNLFTSPASAVYSGGFPDPLYGEQWYLHGGASGGFDMNVIAAWQKGYTGRGVVVSILDDGIQTNHPDLIMNYDYRASTDINGNDNDPMPQDNGDNKHGTRCAGEVAAMAYNGICGVGVAYNASIGGVRMLDGSVNDAVEARALSHNPNHIDIYSASWGPEDDGKTVDGPGPLARRAFIDGVNMGRHGKGSIFVWASGNGGRFDDNCNCDGYTNSIYTLSISSATQHGLKPWYLEECSSTLASTYSSGTPGHDQSVVTVDMDMSLDPQHMCTKEHTGTSASAPLAAAICALALEANPQLTWRDMQYLVVLTSNYLPLKDEEGWISNGVNRKVSHKFGYGLMDAGAMVTMAERWKKVPPLHVCEIPPDTVERIIPNDYGASVEFYLDTNGCQGTHRAVNYLEHVQAKISLNFSPRGNLRIILQSPSQTSSTLLFTRPRDTFKTAFEDWPFLTVHFWGERPTGRWRLTIINAGTKPVVQPGILKRWSLVFYGTDVDPLNPDDRPTAESPMDFPLFSPSSTSFAYAFPKAWDSKILNQPDIPVTLSDRNCNEECTGGCYGDGPTQCANCKHMFMNSGTKKVCVRRCEDGWFASGNLECLKCHSSCRTCSNGSKVACVTCQPALLLLRINIDTQCVSQCPSGFYNAPGMVCQPCSSLCDKCQDAPDRCTKCREGLVLHEKTCMAYCPKWTYNEGNGRCGPCHPSCETCIGPRNFDCVMCPSHLFHLNGTCLKECPRGYHYLTKSNECYSCNPTCETCNDEKCLSCWRGWFLNSKGQCKPTSEVDCQNGMYNEGGQCVSCHISCQTCSGSAYSQCLVCPDNKYLHKGVCLDSCPGTYYINQFKTCALCHETCATCNGDEPEKCLVCKDGLHFENHVCVGLCRESYYSNDGKCVQCHSSCKTCTDNKAESCTSCYPNNVLLGGVCKKDCGLGYFSKGNTCVLCPAMCRSCKGDGLADCLSCPESEVLDGGMCMKCGYNQYFDPLVEKCDMCNSSCATCNGPGIYSCLTCVAPFKRDPLLHRCVPCCNYQSTTNCCHCDSGSDTCVSMLSTNKRRTENEVISMPSNAKGEQKQFQLFHPFMAALIGSVILVIAGFFIIFGALQARSHNYCCSSSGYQRVPTQYSVAFDSSSGSLPTDDLEVDETLWSADA